MNIKDKASKIRVAFSVNGAALPRVSPIAAEVIRSYIVSVNVWDGMASDSFRTIQTAKGEALAKAWKDHTQAANAANEARIALRSMGIDL